MHCNVELINQPVNTAWETFVLQGTTLLDSVLQIEVFHKTNGPNLLVCVNQQSSVVLTERHQFQLAQNLTFFIERNESSFTVSTGKIHYLEILRLHLLNRNYCQKGATLITMYPAQEKASAVILPSCIFCCSVECVFDHILA